MTALNRLIKKIYFCFGVLVISTLLSITSSFELADAAITTIYTNIPSAGLVTCIAGAVTLVFIFLSFVVCEIAAADYKHTRMIVFSSSYRFQDTAIDPGIILHCLRVWKFIFPLAWTLLAISHAGICIRLRQSSILRNLEFSVHSVGIPIYLNCFFSFYLTPRVMKAIKLLAGRERPMPIGGYDHLWIRVQIPDSTNPIGPTGITTTSFFAEER